MDIRDVIENGTDRQNEVRNDSISISVNPRYLKGSEPFGDPTDSLDILYSYLCECTHCELRDINRGWNMRVGGVKNVLIARAMIKIYLLHTSGKSLSDILSENTECRDTNRFLKNINKCPEIVFRAPSMEEMLEVLSGPEAHQLRKAWKKRKGNGDKHDWLSNHESNEVIDISPLSSTKNVQGKNDSSPFTLHEFARLMVILRDDQKTRAAVMQATESTLNRNQLDRKISRDSFWEVVESQFNNDEIAAKEDFRGRIDGLEADLKPKSYREASKLKDAFLDGRSAFTAPMKRWQQSGQNETLCFPNFLRRLANGELSAGGKRAYIMFTVARLGSQSADDSFLRLVCKTIDTKGNDEIGYDECGSAACGTNGESTKANKRTLCDSPQNSMLKHKRRSVDAEVGSGGEQFEKTCNKMAELTDLRIMQLQGAIKSRKAVDENVRSSNEHSTSGGYKELSGMVTAAEQEDKIMSLVSKAAITLERAKESGNARFVAAAQRHFDNMEERYFKMMSEAEK